MNSSDTDILVHTKTVLSSDEFSEVARQVKAIDGVKKFDQIKQKPNFIMVVYSVTQTRALTILNKITRLGYNASLVGI